MKTAYHLLLLFISCTYLSHAQINEWTWVKGANTINNTGFYGTPGFSSPANNPRARYLSSGWTGGSGEFWLFGGSGYNTSTTLEEHLSDLWKYNTSTGNWTWISGDNTANQPGRYGQRGMPSSVNKPGARRLGKTWKDKQGNLWLFGGFGYASTDYGYLSDLWKYNPQLNQWTWMKGDTTANGVRHYGSMGVASPLNSPGARYGSISWSDTAGNFWLFGGYASIAAANAFFNDLWKYDVASNQWTWVKADSTVNPLPMYGTKGTASPLNKPGGRAFMTGYADTLGNLWLLGGIENRGIYVLLNDLWKYNIAANQWTWLKGDSAGNKYGVYGTQGTATPLAVAGSRESATCWIDNNGKGWLIGGYGYAESGTAGYLNDLWNYNPVSNEWAWVKGDKLTNVTGSYGFINVSSSANNPGGRVHSLSWTDSLGNLWLFGGWGYATGATAGVMNDMWKYTPGVVLPLHLLTFTATLQDKTVHLKWTAEHEINFDRYEAERSTNGRDFVRIDNGQLTVDNSAGTGHHYAYDDDISRLPSHISRLYYRLKMIDKDGSFTYSKVEQVQLSIVNLQLSVAPNPVKDKLQVTATSESSETVQLQVIGADGKVLMQKQWRLHEGRQTTSLNTGSLQSGSYFFRLTSANGQNVTTFEKR